MTPEIITTCVIAAFLLILLSGFLFGLGRGFNKSLVRILLVVAMLVITFFVVPAITKAVMALDISNWGITVAGKTATSVTDILVSVLSEIPQVADIAGTTAYATIINVVPQMILNVVLFVVVFILLRLVSMVIYWIITGICFSKKKTEGKNKHRLLGSLVGVVQNFLIFLVILVPVVGTVNILGDIETITTQPTTTAVSTASTNLLTATEEPPAETPENNNQVSPYQTVNDVIDAYEASWVAKFLHGVKLDSACMYVFNELSTVTIDEQKYNLKIEANNITYIVMDVMNLVELGELDLTSPDTIQALNKIIDSCYNSQLTSNLIDEVIPLATSKWLAGETFCGMSKPTVEGFDGVIDTLLTQLGTSKDLRATLISTTKMLGSVFNTATDILEGEEINVDQIGTFLEELSQDESTLDLAKNLLSEENLETIVDKVIPGEDPDNYKGIITETVTNVLNADYSQEGVTIGKEIEVVTETLKVAEKLMNPDAENPFVQDDADKVIEKLSESTVILNTISAENSDIRTKLNEELNNNTVAQDMVKEAIEKLDDSNVNKDLLMQIFGFATAEPPAAE